jgi:hypothetical protein
MKPESERYRDLARLLIKTRPDDMTCDEWLDRVSAYAETVLAGRSVGPAFADVERHMEHCPGCCEEFNALLAALRDTE